jgi:hypothetical protein
MWDRHINFSKGELKHLIEGQSDLRDPIAEWNGKALLTPAGALAAARNLPAFIAELPKAELHCHIEGTLTPRRAYLTAKTNYPVLESKMDPAGAAQRREEFTSLLPFLMEYNDSSAVLKTRADFRGLMLDYCPRLPGARGAARRPSRSSAFSYAMKIDFVWGFCMGVQGECAYNRPFRRFLART